MKAEAQPKTDNTELYRQNKHQSLLQVIIIIWSYLQIGDTIWKEKKKLVTIYRKSSIIRAESVLPRIHCSDSILHPSGLLPVYFPMQMPACRTVLQIVPPQSSISSTRLWVGGWESSDTNMAGWFWNRSCWCSPADRCLWRRQIWAR